MADYRRWYIPGGTYFFTLVTYQRRPLFQEAAARALLGDLMRQQTSRMPFQTVAIVLLWDHLHCLWTLPAGDDDYSGRWKDIKATFTRNWLRSGGKEQPVSCAKAARGRRGVWQPRFYEHAIRDEQDLENHADYLHFNPVKHGYVKRPWDWQWSSFRRFVQMGQYSGNWAAQGEPLNIRMMECG
jgi:putative transposase